VRQRFCWYANTIVADLQNCGVPLGTGDDNDVTVRSGVLDRIIEEIHQHLLDASLIPDCLNRTGRGAIQ
jgi:hypothetical protein